MAPRGVKFRTIAIDKMPGIRPGYRIDRFNDGVNIIYGPNGVGKTSLMRALHSMLWSDGQGTGDIEARCDIIVGDDPWNIRLDRNVHSFFRNGTPVDSLPVQHSDTVNKYVISLHELLKEENKEFADHVVRQMAGGFNIDQALTDLGWDKDPKKISYKKYQDTRDELKRLKRNTQTLVDDERGLDSLKDQEEQSIKCNRMLHTYGQLLSRLDHLDLRNIYRSDLDELPPVLDRLSKDKLDNVIGLFEKIEERKTEKNLKICERNGLIDSRKEQAFPDKAPSEGDIDNLRERSRSCEKDSKELKKLDTSINKLSEREESLRRQIGEVIQRDRLKDVGVLDFNRIAQFSSDETEIAGRKNALMSLGRVIDDDSPLNDNNIRAALRCLDEWLSVERNKRTVTRFRIIGSLGSLGLVASSIIMAVSNDLIWLLASAAGAAMLIALWIPENGDTLTGSMRNYAGYGFESPSNWSVIEVSRVREVLLDQLGHELGRKQLKQLCSAMKPTDDKLDADTKALEMERRAILDQYGIPIDLRGRSIQVLTDALSKWKHADEELTEQVSERETISERFEKELAVLSNEVQRYGLAGLGCAEEGTGRLKDLYDRFKSLRDLDLRLTSLKSKIDDLRTEIEDMERELISATEEIGTVELETIISLREKIDEYVGRKDKFKEEESSVNLIESQLTGHEDLFSLNREEIEDRRRLAQDTANEITDIQTKISDVKSNIRKAGTVHDILQTNAKLARSEAELIKRMESSKDLFIGRTIAEHIKGVMAEKQRPAVFERARRIFSDITKGAYELRFGDTNGGRFIAFDNLEGEERSLDELSSATRVQLLLAVRVAFLEEQEPIGPMPLFLDEALANSDDRRAAAIIDSMIELARQGRQIFYLTAQSDEEVKWRSRMEGHSDVSYTIIELARQRDISDQKAEPFEASALEREKVPVPDGMDRSSYCVALGVPRFEPRRGARSAHLWYVVDDVNRLHDLLSMGIVTWGQMKGYMENGGRIGNAEGPVVETIRTAGLVLERTAELWSEGRARSLSQEDLERMGIGSEAQIAELVEINDRKGNDARGLIDALRSGDKPKRWQDKRTDELEELLRSKNLIVDGECLDRAEIRARVLGNFDDQRANGLLKPQKIDEVLAMFP